MSPEIGIVVPTLGTRPHYLEACIASLRQNCSVHICVVGPATTETDPIRTICDSFVSDTGRGLAAAINIGIASLPQSVKFVNWLGDDDVVSADGLGKLSASLTTNEDVVLAYGHCHYINTAGETLFTVRPGRWAETLLRYGPQRISQPAMLFRRDSFRDVGGLDEGLGWAFDLDLLLNLRRHGHFRSVPQVVASYRWHEGALTVGSRKESVREASSVRVRHLHPVMRALSWLWEPLVRVAITKAAKLVTRKVQKL